MYYYESSQFRAGIRAPAVGKLDEIHNLNLATRAGAEVSDQLKYFAERLPATFVYSGIDVEGEGLFAGVALDDYLYRRSSGMIGSLSQLIRPAPWPTRDSPPGPRGGRPLLAPVRKIFLGAPRR